MGQRDVHPLSGRETRLGAPSGPATAELGVERHRLLCAGDDADQSAQPLARSVPVRHSEEEKTLVVLVEPAEDVALDVRQVQHRIAGRLDCPDG